MPERIYMRVRWLHEDADYPIELWHELDGARCETRKLEYFRDGSVGFARVTKDVDGSRTFEEVGGTVIGDQAIPFLSEIAAQPEFEPGEVSEADFEERWQRRFDAAAAVSRR